MPVAASNTAADRWSASGPTAGPRFQAGVEATTKDPGALAAAQVQKLLTNLTASITSGRWQRRVTEGGPAKWKAATVLKVPNYVNGFTAGKSNYQVAYAAMEPIMNQTQSAIEAMPKNGLPDSVARATRWMTDLHNWALNRP